jgi:outer membrane protein
MLRTNICCAQQRPLRSISGLAMAIALTLGAALPAHADNFADLLEIPGSAGLGAVVRSEKSPYIDGGIRYDILPLYLYEGDRLYLHGGRVGLKVFKDESGGGKQSLNLFIEQRFEGFPGDKVPAVLAGMAPRSSGLDLGLSWSRKADWGVVQAELLHDVGSASNGTEARLSYAYPFRAGKWSLHPQVTLAARDSKLNDYYYGVRPGEAAPGRPAYAPGAGVNATLALYGSYDVSERWRLLGGLAWTRFDQDIRKSPIVRDKPQTSVYLGAAYDFGAYKRAWTDEKSDTHVKLLYGRAGADNCILVKIVTLNCVQLDKTTPTSVTGVQIGKPFIKQLKGWPLDFVGYVGLLRHDENGYQPNGYDINAFMKAYYYGFPWNDRVQTRLGLGVGFSLADRPNYQEVTSQAKRGRPTSRLLNYLEPSVDVSLGDLIKSYPLKDTFIGVGVSHRSGIFGSSRVLGNVNGGSNYIFTYVEMKL